MSKAISKTTHELTIQLRNIFDDDEYVEGILIYVSNATDRRKLLNFILYGDDVDIETVTVYALNLHDARISKS